MQSFSSTCLFEWIGLDGNLMSIFSQDTFLCAILCKFNLLINRLNFGQGYFLFCSFCLVPICYPRIKWYFFCYKNCSDLEAPTGNVPQWEVLDVFNYSNSSGHNRDIGNHSWLESNSGLVHFINCGSLTDSVELCGVFKNPLVLALPFYARFSSWKDKNVISCRRSILPEI